MKKSEKRWEVTAAANGILCRMQATVHRRPAHTLVRVWMAAKRVTPRGPGATSVSTITHEYTRDFRDDAKDKGAAELIRRVLTVEIGWSYPRAVSVRGLLNFTLSRWMKLSALSAITKRVIG